MTLRSLLVTALAAGTLTLGAVPAFAREADDGATADPVVTGTTAQPAAPEHPAAPTTSPSMADPVGDGPPAEQPATNPPTEDSCPDDQLVPEMDNEGNVIGCSPPYDVYEPGPAAAVAPARSAHTARRHGGDQELPFTGTSRTPLLLGIGLALIGIGVLTLRAGRPN